MEIINAVADVSRQAGEWVFSIPSLETILSKLLLFSFFVRRSARLSCEETYGVQIRSLSNFS